MLNKIKKNRFQKYLYLSPIGLLGVLLPVCLTSCANISQYILPITTGDLSSGPFSNMSNGIFSGPSSPNDFFGKSISDYTPNNYITYINRSASNSVNGYGYENPQDIDNEKDDKTDFKNFGYGYYGSNDQKLKYITDKDSNQTIKSYQNINLGIDSQAISQASSTLSSLFDVMVHFVSQTGIISSDSNHREDWINRLFNTDSTNDNWHGSKDNPESPEFINNKKFYEFLFDSNNLLSTGKVHHRFDISTQNFDFVTNPFINKDECGGAAGDALPPRDSVKLNIYSNKKFDPRDSDSIHNTNPYVSAYASYSDCANANEDGKTYHYLSNFAYSIPSLISLFSNDRSTTQFSYYDPIKNRGYIPNEYLNVNMDKVTNEIDKSNSWKKIDDLIGGKEYRTEGGINKSFSIDVNDHQINNAIQPPTVDGVGLDPALTDIINGLRNTSQSSFIALNTYTVASYKLPTDHIPGVEDDQPDVKTYYEDITDSNGKDKDGSDATNVHIPLFYGIEPNLYPVGLLFKNITAPDSGKGEVQFDDFDTNLLQEKTQAIYIDPKTGKVRPECDIKENKLNYLDLNKLNDKFLQFMTFLTTMVKKNNGPTDYQIKYKSKYFNGNLDNMYFINLYKSIFGNHTSDDFLYGY